MNRQPPAISCAVMFAVVALTLGACSTQGGNALELAHCTSQADLQAAFVEREQSVATFRGQARFEYEGPQGHRKLSWMVSVDGAARLRIDVMTAFGPAWSVTVEGGRVAAWDRGEGVLYLGTAGRESLARMTDLDLPLNDMIYLLRGLPPATAGDVLTRSWSSDDGCTVSSAADGADRWSATLRVRASDVVAAQRYGSSGEVLWRAQFKDWKKTDGVRLPYELQLELSDGGRIRLVYSRIWRNLDMGGELFRLEPGPGVKVVEV